MQTSPPKRLLIVYHSTTGGTERMVQTAALAAGTEPGVIVDLRRAVDTAVAQLTQADGYIFATPENLGSMSGLMKDFFDRTYYGVIDQIQGRPYCTMICAGSDGRGAAKQIERIATGWRLKPIQEALIINVNAQTPEEILSPKQLTDSQVAACHNVGQLFGAGLSMAVF
uniref:flavodoxin family protein n=1 Tax=Orrella sp. TaxID=1921583 RepID=UPI0040479704